MKKRKLKPFVKISAIGVFLIVCLVSIVSLSDNKTNTVSKTSDDFTYVNDYIFDNYYPVVNQEEKLTKPYTSEKVMIRMQRKKNKKIQLYIMKEYICRIQE